MKDRKAGRKSRKGVRVAYRNDHAAVKRWAESSRQALLPMLELLENAPASIDHGRSGARHRRQARVDAQVRAGAARGGRNRGREQVSKSAVSRRFIEASAAQLAALNEQRWPTRRCCDEHARTAGVQPRSAAERHRHRHRPTAGIDLVRADDRLRLCAETHGPGAK